MLVINGKATLKIGNRVFFPGDELDIPEELAQKLSRAGLVETATTAPPERAAIHHKGGGWYELDSGEVVRGKENAMRGDTNG